MPKNIIPSIRPVIPKPIIPVIKKDNNLNNINKIQEKKPENKNINESTQEIKEAENIS